MRIKLRFEEDSVMAGGVSVGCVEEKGEWVEIDGEMLAVKFWFAYCKGSAPKFKTRENALKYIVLCLDIEDGFIDVKWNNNSHELRTETEIIGNVFNDGTWVANPYNIEGRDGFETMEEAMAALEEMLEVVR